MNNFKITNNIIGKLFDTITSNIKNNYNIYNEYYPELNYDGNDKTKSYILIIDRKTKKEYKIFCVNSILKDWRK